MYCHKYEWKIYTITPKFTILTLLSICFNIIVILGSPRHVASSFSMHSLSLLSGNPDTFKALHNSAWVWSDVTNASSLITTEKQIDNFANHFSPNFFIKSQICYWYFLTCECTFATSHFDKLLQIAITKQWLYKDTNHHSPV